MKYGGCWECNKRFMPKKGGGVIYEVRYVNGHPVKLHKDCARRFDKEEAANNETARERK